jgi:hypothetical protein
MAACLTNYRLIYLGYSTVRDYTRYYEQYPHLLGPKGDLKDVQRPWALEAVREHVPKGAKVIDLGGASCELASCLDDYEVTVIDPYDGRGGGPRQMDHLQRKYPRVSFICAVLNANTNVRQEYQAVVSTSVIEHIPPPEVFDTLVGIDKALLVGGKSIHAIDFTVRGEGRIKTLTDQVLENFVAGYALEKAIDDLRQEMIHNHETYYLSLLMYQQWRKQRRYEEYL